MPDPTPIPLGEVEAAARPVAHRPWRQHEGTWVVSDSGGQDDGILIAAVPEFMPENATHIATADPPTVTVLCEALRLARGRLSLIVERGAPPCDDPSPSTCGFCATAGVAATALAGLDALIDFGTPDA